MPLPRGKMLRAGVRCICLLLLTGCAATGAMPNEMPAPTREPGLVLAASHYPVYLAALQIVSDMPEIRLSCFLQPQGGYLEDYRLSGPDWARAQGADILLMAGGGLEEFIPAFTAEDGKPLIVAAEHVVRLPGRILDPDEDTLPAENPYIWLSPGRWASMVDGIAAGLTQIDPERQAAYVAANDAAQAQIQAFGNAFATRMQPYAGRPVIVMHPALAYLAEDANLTTVLTIERDPGILPTAVDIAELEALIAPYPDAILLLESDAPLALRTLGGHKAALLTPLCLGVQNNDPATWQHTMEQNIQTLIDALSPS